MRLNRFPRARRERAALRAHQSLWAASRYSAQRYAIKRPLDALAGLSLLSWRSNATRPQLRCKRSAHARRAFQLHARNRNDIEVSPGRSRPASETERSNTTLPTNSGARGAQHAFAPGARKTAQPHARKYVEPADFGTIRSRSANEAGPTRTDRTGACFPSASARAAQRLRPSVRQRESQTAAPQAPRVLTKDAHSSMKRVPGAVVFDEGDFFF